MTTRLESRIEHVSNALESLVDTTRVLEKERESRKQQVDKAYYVALDYRTSLKADLPNGLSQERMLKCLEEIMVITG